ncbi:MAG: ABC transporter permease, partial [Rhodocyclaceae bacterium]|nr:ABC transporter permease [Rhodocyclaceae bacterium]
EALARHWRAPQPAGLALWLRPGGTVEDAEAALRSAGVQPGEWFAQGDIKRQSMKIFERSFAMTAAMNTLTLLVAGVALLCALLAIVHERLPEFAQWRALGVTRRELLRVIAVPLAMFVAITWLLAIPLGALLSWLLIHELNVMSFGWSMPMRWSPLPALRLGALGGGVVALVLALVFVQLTRTLPRALAQLGSAR